MGGSIPACTGEPLKAAIRIGLAAVYPRVYGGTMTVATPTQKRRGLSPRVRGNPSASLAKAARNGSIPACTGEPIVGLSEFAKVPVYPRVYGGTAGRWLPVQSADGLSPRVRGNPDTGKPCQALKGSIPACTGEPGDKPGRAGQAQVYPRVYGGTCCLVAALPAVKGLSPRVRGNRASTLPEFIKTRSIPACTGEPDGNRMG